MLYVPEGQKEHADSPTYEVNFPAGHEAQVDVLVLVTYLYLPAEQREAVQADGFNVGTSVGAEEGDTEGRIEG